MYTDSRPHGIGIYIIQINKILYYKYYHQYSSILIFIIININKYRIILKYQATVLCGIKHLYLIVKIFTFFFVLQYAIRRKNSQHYVTTILG